MAEKPSGRARRWRSIMVALFSVAALVTALLAIVITGNHLWDRKNSECSRFLAGAESGSYYIEVQWTPMPGFVCFTQPDGEPETHRPI